MKLDLESGRLPGRILGGRRFVAYLFDLVGTLLSVLEPVSRLSARRGTAIGFGLNRSPDCSTTWPLRDTAGDNERGEIVGPVARGPSLGIPSPGLPPWSSADLSL